MARFEDERYRSAEERGNRDREPEYRPEGRGQARQQGPFTERWNPGMQSDSGPQNWQRGDPDFGIGSEYGPEYAFRDFGRADQIRDRWVRDFEKDAPARERQNWTEDYDRFNVRGMRQAGHGRFAGVGPKNYRRSDERIREDICDRLTERGDIDPSQAEVNVRDGEVTLTGAVQDRYTKRAIEDAAAEVVGVRDVHNQIRVQREGGQELDRAA